MKQALLLLFILIGTLSFSQRGRLQRSDALNTPKPVSLEENVEKKEKPINDEPKKDTCNCNTDLEYDSERDMTYIKIVKGSPPYTGACVSYYPNTYRKQLEATFIEGKEDGKTIKYYKNGIKNAQLSHKAGVKDGEWKFWAEDSTLLWSKNYAAGELDGEQHWYYEDGKLKKIERYSAGVKNGKTEEYFETGALKKEIGYKDNEFDGPYKKYTIDSILVIDMNYKNGKEDGECSYYYSESGKLGYKKMYDKGKPDGTWNYYYENGNEKAIEVYKNGKKDGVWKAWYDNQKLQFEIEYKKDQEISKKEYDRYGRQL